jgi:hypothetical protein
MKMAYVSLVLPTTNMPDDLLIERIDLILQECAKSHEIVLVLPFVQMSNEFKDYRLTGPLSIVRTKPRTTLDEATIAGLAKSVGDFVIEWRGSLEEIQMSLIEQILQPTNDLIELLEVFSIEKTLPSRFFYWAVNALRSKDVPIRKTVVRVYSRRVVQTILRVSSYEPQLDVQIADFPVRRSSINLQITSIQGFSLKERIKRGLLLLSKGTRFGSAVPLVLAGVSAFFAGIASAYAIFLLLFVGKAPEGWTTLMVLIGFGQASILIMLGLMWARIDSLTKGLSGAVDKTEEVYVHTPKKIISDPHSNQ